MSEVGQTGIPAGLQGGSCGLSEPDTGRDQGVEGVTVERRTRSPLSRFLQESAENPRSSHAVLKLVITSCDAHAASAIDAARRSPWRRRDSEARPITRRAAGGAPRRAPTNKQRKRNRAGP